MTLILSGTDGLSDVDGSAATPAIRGTDANTGIFFPAADTIAFSEGGVEAMRIDSSGNVGIGTSSPSALLHVSNIAAKVRIGSTASSEYLDISRDSASGVIVYNAAQASFGAHVWQIAGTERARIDPSGNLLVGVNSGSNARLYVVADAGVTSPFIINNTQAGTSAGSIQVFRRNGTNTGTIDNTGTTTAYNTSSDYRLKHEIAPMTGALAKVTALKPVTYKWNADGSAGEGFIAHELQEICPDAVTGEKDGVETYTDEDGVEQTRPKYQGIDTSFLVATLTAAIQEQQALILSLTTRLTALENK
jgi:hypothetical protein